MSKEPAEKPPESFEHYNASYRSTVWTVVSISFILAVVAMIGTAI